MKRPILAHLVLVALTASQGIAAEPAAESKAEPKEKASARAAPDAPSPVIPERQLKFVVSEEGISRTLAAADPGLMEQRYIAIFRSESSPRRPRSPLSSRVDRKLQYLYQEYSSSPLRPGLFQELTTNVAQERLPQKDILHVISSYTAARSPYLTHREVPNGDRYDRKYYHHFEILAPTPERAEELVRAFLSVYDYGLFCPIQQEYLRLKRDFEQRLPKYHAAGKEAKQELAKYEKQLDELKEYEDVGEEALVNFTTQLRLISVDLAGIQARTDACNKILGGATGKRLTPSRVEQIEMLKITAEIELVGLAAKKAAIEEIVDKGRRRVELLGEVKAARTKVARSESLVSGTERLITEYETARQEYMPLPIQDGKVTIHPLKWEPAERS